MQEQLRAILPHVQNVALALGVLSVAYLLTIPLRRAYAASEGIEPARRSLRQFIRALLSYPAFSILVLVLSIPVTYWFYSPQTTPVTLPDGQTTLVERPFDQAWLLPQRHCDRRQS